jgi:acyl-homoserine-lactone acylase
MGLRKFFWLAATAALTITAAQTQAAAQPSGDMARWRAQAARVSIVRDDWGIAHVRGKTDADAVFGMVYAQAEDDFNRVETNYINAMGRLAEAEGEDAVWQDLRMKLFVDPADLKAKYAASPAWLKSVMNAWADGLNFYLASHPAVKPRVITHFEPWMALSFTEGSIGGDIEKVSLKELASFYGNKQLAEVAQLLPEEPKGSNGMAIGPQITTAGHAMLLINPHTSFFFRSELQMTSDEGLNAYGAATWGQPFLYQGFNDHVGWMHTTSGLDAVDEFAETIVRKDGKAFYRYGAEERPLTVKTIEVPFRQASGAMGKKTFTVYATHHGPIVRSAGGKWIAIALMNKPLEALEQSYLRTKATDLASFMKVAELKANSSNNTLFADTKGETAYLHPQFIPKRDDRFDYTQPVDGSDPATDWKGLHALSEAPQVISPKGGWLYNSNDAPWRTAGPESPKASAFPRYMDQVGFNPRTEHATRVLSNKKDFTLPGLIAAAYDSYLPAFEHLVPSLAQAYDATPDSDPLKAKLKDQVAALKAWNYRWGETSTETSLAVFWGEALWQKIKLGGARPSLSAVDRMVAASPQEKLQALAEASDRLQADFGSWKTPWGQINRYQRNNGDIVQKFDDAKPSTPVMFTSAQWGSLASFGAKRYDGTKRYYGTSGNSFVAAIEFGPKIVARAVSAGGESGNPASKHFGDQATRYATGNLREVYFYPEQLKGHTERTYKPGE